MQEDQLEIIQKMFPTGFFILVKHPNGQIVAIKSDPTAKCPTLDYFMRISNIIADATK